jgi:hypothetical protein
LPSLFGLGIWLFFLIGMLAPDSWWGTHYTAFLPAAWAWGLMGISLGLILFPVFVPQTNRFARLPKLGNPGKIILYVSFAAISGWLMHQFPIQDDNYGNAGSLHGVIENSSKSLPDGYWSELLTPALEPGKGRGRVFLMAYGTAHQFGLDILGGYRLMDAVCGGLYVLSWLVFAGFYFRKKPARILFLLAAFSAPTLLLFFGHTESYAPGLLIFSAWMQVLLWFQRSRNRLGLWALLPLWLIGTQINELFLLLFPVLVLVFVEAILSAESSFRRITSMRGMLVGLFLPICLLGLLAYFFIFGDHIDPRSLDDFRDIDRLFLPLASPDPPLDRYNLLSFNHLFDLLNVVIFSSPGVLLLLSVLGIQYRKQINWNGPALVASVFALLLLSAMLFMVNPLFSLPMDWDLYGMALPAALAILAVLLSQLESQADLSKLLGPVLGLGLMLLPTVMVNNDSAAHARRLESVGIHAFKTYYIHSDRYLLYALNQADLSPDEYLDRKSTLIDKLRPYALPGNDPKFGALLLDQAIVLKEATQDLSKSRSALGEAESFMQLDNSYVLMLMELQFRLGDYSAAHGQAVRLIAAGYPDRKQALRMGVHTALEAGLYQEAAGHCREYLDLVPDDGLIQEVYRRLQLGDRVGELKDLFSKG